jgi:KUP system potassium uptake protein
VTLLSLGALGVVFGDIGTSPLYTMAQCLRVSAEESHRAVTRADVLGILSLIFWALTLVVSVKYLLFILRADNQGEGGILALLALVPDHRTTSGRITVVAFLVIVGAALLYGDGAITPAISVLSAIEGLAVARPALERWVVPLTCGVLVGLFAIQHRGTGSMGRLFGPVMLVWFATLGALGAWHILEAPSVLAALLPIHALGYLTSHGPRGLLILGSVVLAVTGGEALYADMGHFGSRPIRVAWLSVVKPALLLCYFGQGALVLSHPETIKNPFFSLVNGTAPTLALVLLSSMATVIASQALISGAYSLTRQAMQLGVMPRMTVVHTAADAEGQIYVPEVNWLLMVVCVALVVMFRRSSNLAAAYGIAVTGTMGITSVVYFIVTRRTWKWSLFAAIPLLVLFLAFDIPFFVTNLFKFADGGYVPVSIAVVIATLMLIWSRGRRLLRARLIEDLPDLRAGLDELCSTLVARIPGTGVFLTSDLVHIPPVLRRHVEKNRVLHEHVILVGVKFASVPYVDADQRTTVERLGNDIDQVRVNFGYMDRPQVVLELAACARSGQLVFDPDKATYYIGRETILAGRGGGMGTVTETIFAFLQRNAVSADRHFGLPPQQVVEVGTQLDL